MNEHRCSGMVFGPGLPPGGVRADVVMLARGMHVAPGTMHERVVEWGRLAATWTGFNRTAWSLAWEDGGAWAVIVEESAARDAAASDPPEGMRALVAALDGQRTRGSRGTRLALMVMGAVALLPLVATGVLLANRDALIDAAVNAIPREAERVLGEGAWADLRGEARVVEDAEVNAAVRQVGERLVKGSSYAWTFHVVVDDEVNAFALPGGVVVVNTGLLLDAQNAEEVAGVLAHEVQHVERRHGLRGAVAQLGLLAAVLLLVGDSSAGAVVGDLVGLGFSREQELEADRLGVDTLQRANIDPRGLRDFFQRLARKGDGVPAFLSTHPASDDRVAAINALLGAHAERVFPALPGDWSALRAKVNQLK